MDDSVIIIGAGLSGLSAACHARINGYRTRIFERQSRPGGVAACWRRGDYLIDGGIHFAMAMQPGSAVRELLTVVGVLPSVRFVETSVYAQFTDAATGRSLEVTRDLGRLAGDLKALFPQDARLVDELIAGAQLMGRSGAVTFGMEKPPELTTLLDRLAMFWRIRGVMRYFGGKFSRPMSKYASAAADPWLRHILLSMFLPEVPVWFVMMILGLLASGGMALIEDGSSAFAGAIEERVRDLGGDITYGAHVEEIIVEGDRAVGVRLGDGSEHRAGAVIAAGDGWYTVYKLLGGRFTDGKIEQRFRAWPLTRPLVLASFGVAREFSEDPWLTMLRLDRPIVIGSNEIGAMSIRLFNYSRAFSPPGKTALQVGFESDWDYWRALRDDRPRYDAEKDRVAHEILDRLEAIYPGIAAQVEVTDVVTPYTTWRYTLNRDGAYMGWLMSPERLMGEIPRTLPGLRGLYLAGQWVTTGGVPSALYSGRHAVQLLCHDRGQRFRV